jgi:hypothetical protein
MISREGFMAKSSLGPLDDWNRLKPDVELAVAELLSQIQSASANSSSQDLLDSYLFAKRLLAEAMRAFIRVDLDVRSETFHSLRAKLNEEMHNRYADRVPDAYLRVPYGSRGHEELFMILLKRMGTSVPAALLRVVTADSVHTERRTRELRELGLDVDSSSKNGVDVYTLNSLEIDTSKIPVIIANLAKKDKYRSLPEAKLQAILEETD